MISATCKHCLRAWCNPAIERIMCRYVGLQLPLGEECNTMPGYYDCITCGPLNMEYHDARDAKRLRLHGVHSERRLR